MEKKPFICGGYTQQDWDIINGSNFDIEFYNDYCNTPMEKTKYVARITKPTWA